MSNIREARNRIDNIKLSISPCEVLDHASIDDIIEYYEPKEAIEAFKRSLGWRGLIDELGGIGEILSTIEPKEILDSLVFYDTGEQDIIEYAENLKAKMLLRQE